MVPFALHDEWFERHGEHEQSPTTYPPTFWSIDWKSAVYLNGKKLLNTDKQMNHTGYTLAFHLTLRVHSTKMAKTRSLFMHTIHPTVVLNPMESSVFQLLTSLEATRKRLVQAFGRLSGLSLCLVMRM